MSFSAQARRRLLVGAAAALLVVVAMGFLVGLDVTLADRWDDVVGDPLLEWTARHHTVEQVAIGIQAVFRTLPMAAYTLVVAGVLLLKGFRRTAAWVVVVMALVGTTTFLMKISFGRPRPTDALLLLSDKAFPSGHASGIAGAAGVALVLASIFVRRRSQRRLVLAGAVFLVLLVGLDRLLLGVHGLTDVITGWSVGAFWVLLAAYVVDPGPRASAPTPLVPSPVPVTKQVAVILNPVKVEDPTAFRTLVDSMAMEAGWSPPTWFETTVEDTGRSMAEQAAIDGADLVLVCGGDGTVRTVCAELAGTGIPVGVVPAGTGNLLARNLALPLHLRLAVEVGLNGQDRAIDLVKISGDGFGPDEHFLVMAGMGLDAAIMEGANDAIKAKVGWLAYVVSGFRNLMFAPVRVEISVDGGPVTKHRARTVVVGNVGMLQGGLPLIPDATLDDGVLDVVVINPARFLSWLRVVARVLSRNRRTDQTVHRVTGRTVTIKASHPTPRQVDGDPVGAGSEMTCEVLPGKLLVRVPR